MTDSVVPQQKGFLLGHSSDRFHAAPSLIQLPVLIALITLGNVYAYGLDNNKEISLITDTWFKITATVRCNCDVAFG